MVLVFDLDDTICETDIYSENYIKHFIYKENLPYRQIATSTRFAERKFDWPTEVALAWYKTYGDRMMLEFPCKAGAREVLRKLHDEGHTIVISTARDTDWHTRPKQITKQWLKNNGIVYDMLICGRTDKETICKEVDADVFVDDDIANTNKVATYFTKLEKPTVCLLMHSKYNASMVPNDAVKRVVTMEDVYRNIFALNKQNAQLRLK